MRALVRTLVILSLLMPTAAIATISPTPSSVAINAGDVSGTISVDITFPLLPALPPSASLVFSGLPPGVTTIPSPVTFPVMTGGPAILATFQLATSAGTPGGIYPIAITTSPDIGAGVGNLTLVVQAPTFDATIAPVPLQLPWGGSGSVTVSTITGGGFSSAVTYGFSGFPSGITVGGPQTVSTPYPPATFTFGVAPRTVPGSYTGSLTASWTAAGPNTRTFPMTVIVQPPALSATFNPAAVAARNGGPSVSSSLVLTPGAGYTGTPSVAWTATPPGLTVTPATFTPSAVPPMQSIPVNITAAGTPVGPQGLTVSVTDPGAGIDVTATLTVTVAAAYDAAISASPPTLSVPAGGNSNITVTATGLNGFTGPLDVKAPTAPSLTFTPAAFSISPGESKLVVVSAAASATPTLVPVTFVASAPEISGSRTVTLMVNVTPQIPEITSATPPALTAGTIGKSVILTGKNFKSGAVASFTPAGPMVTRTTVRSATLAEVLVTTPAGTPTGAYTVDLRNPDGGATSHGLPVIVCAPSSLGAPLGVPTAAIVFPRPYTAIAKDESIRPRGVLATTGLGTVVGTWRLDGVPFDQFAIAVSGGLPAEVEAKMPIPAASAGEHRLELVIEQPQRLTTDPVPVILTVESKSGLKILSPDLAVVDSTNRPVIRWSLVPGASGYEVEIDPETSAWPVRVRVSKPEWQPDPRFADAVGPGSHRYRVAAVFPGEIRGEATPWRSITVSNGEHARHRDRRAADAHPRTLHSFGDIELVSLKIQDPDDSESGETNEEDVTRSSTWQVAMLGSASATDEDIETTVDAARLQLTGQFEFLDESFELRGSGDVSGRKDLDPEYTAVSESRSWQVELGALQSSYREDFKAGYSPPEFLDQSEFLSAGLARGGGLAKLTTPIGSFSYYDTFLDDAAGAVSTYDLSQRVSGAGWETPPDTGVGLLRIIGLRSLGRGADSTDTTSEAIGVFWRKSFDPRLNLLVEAAWGSLDSTSQEESSDLDGYGVHVGLDGISGTVSYAFNFRSVDSGLANPANLGLTPGAVPDRIGGDMTVGKSFGAKRLSFNLRRLESGSLANGAGEDVTEDTGGLSFSMPLGQTAALSLTSMVTRSSADPDPDHYVLGLDRTMVVLGVAVSEVVGTMAMSQSLSWQDLSDDFNPAFDSRVTMGSLTFTGSTLPWLALNAMLSGSRTESAPPVGVTSLYMATFQPTIQWVETAVSVTPTASFTRLDSELGGTSDTEQYQLIALWSPGWWNSFLNLQLAASWLRNTVEGLPRPGFDQQIAGTLILRWGSTHESTPGEAATTATLSPTEILRRAELERSHRFAR